MSQLLLELRVFVLSWQQRDETTPSWAEKCPENLGVPGVLGG
jgi:hypothetical protein